jgi:hypothetical protein
MLLHQIVKELPFKFSNDSKFKISTMKVDTPRRYENTRRIYKNWYPAEEQNKKSMLNSLFNCNGNFESVDIEFESNRKDISHSRFLRIEFTNRKSLTIRFDQGMGHWLTNEYDTLYPFNITVDDQIKWIENNASNIRIIHSQGNKTHLFIKIESN